MLSGEWPTLQCTPPSSKHRQPSGAGGRMGGSRRHPRLPIPSRHGTQDRLGRNIKGKGSGTNKDHKHIKPRASQGCMHTGRETEVGISSLQPHSQHHTSQPRWWPSRNSSRQAGSSSMHGGYAGSDGRCVTTPASNRCRQREAINTSAAWDWGKAQGNQCSPVVSHHSE